jgi:hypothetical protein
MTRSIVWTPLQSEFSPVFKSSSQDQNSPFWSSSNRHPVSFISLAAYLDFFYSSFHPSYLSSHLSSLFHLPLVNTSGSASTPSHTPSGPSVTIPSVRGPKLSHQRLHPHYQSPSRTTLSEA